jgi:DNA-binding CsgD family transcriptional regulator
LLALLIITISIKFRFPSFASRGELFIGLPIGLLWLWLLRSFPRLWIQTSQELREGIVLTANGQVQCEVSGNVGLIQVPHYQIHVAEHNFRVDKQIYFQFKNREHYKVIYTPRSKTLLGGVQIPATDQSRSTGKKTQTKSQVNADEILIDPLTDQDKKILQRIAAGLSNKEIASELALSTNTIKMYTSKLYRKLGVRRRTEAIARARELELLQHDE